MLQHARSNQWRKSHWRSLLFLMLLVASPLTQASSWKIEPPLENLAARSPNNTILLKMQKPKEGIWGFFYVPTTIEQTEALKKHRIDKYFSYINGIIEIDGYQHLAIAKVDEHNLFIRIQIEKDAWEHLKEGKSLILRLPDGTELKDTLKGSHKVLSRLETKVFLGK